MSNHSYKWSRVGLLGLLLLVACASPSPPAMPPTPIPATATPSATAPSVQTVTLDENGGTITLKIGERFLLELGENYDWTVTVADQTILSRVVNVTVVRGAQGLYEAHKPGTTKLTAVGDPFCRKAQPPCAAPSLLFEIEVIVK